MKKILKNNYKIIIGILIGIILSVTSVYAIDAYIESNKVTYDNHNGKITKKDNVQDSIDELYERSGIHKEKWTDPVLNGADPVLKAPLIPVEIKSNGDVYYANENSEWYNYSEKRWANVVILVDNPSNTNYTVGDHIIEDDIKGYFVWIPRYQYKIWDLGKYSNVYEITAFPNSNYETSPVNAFNKSRIIDIKFGDINEAPKMAEPTTTNVYYTHPAFTLGDKDLNGIWVGKFETGYKGANSTESAQVNNEEPNSVIIKPDVYSWRYIKVKNMFMTSYNYERELDSHMLKNTEWGAAAYLSHSAYGRGTELNINNNSEYKTGYSAAANTNQETLYRDYGNAESGLTVLYNTEVGYLASTTGNISGIYDMVGGAWDAMAGCVENTVGDSGFDTSSLSDFMNKGYIDKYSGSNYSNAYNNRILGDATGEMGPFYKYYDGDDHAVPHNAWYIDGAAFVTLSSPWFRRGSQYYEGKLTGQFTFYLFNGNEISYMGFRIALAVQ